ncbi:protein gp37 [Paraburkholderia sp. WP4_3_2]|nr:protein gp37 [Paraburkholderia sp. WP4_3_2]
MSDPIHLAAMHECVDWVIVGGESGPHARPMHPTWALDLYEQCAGARVPFLFKQWGEWLPRTDVADIGARKPAGVWLSTEGHAYGDGLAAQREPGDGSMVRLGKKCAGRMLDGREHHAFPTVAA